MRTIMLSLFGRARRRSLMPRLLTKRVPRRLPSVVGACGVCGVQFAASQRLVDRVPHGERPPAHFEDE